MTLVPTPHGEARLTHHPAGYGGAGTALILHGAGTDTATPLLLGLAGWLADHGIDTWRLDQPYTLGTRRPPAPAGQLDTVATAVITELGTGVPRWLIGRSSGSRVACRIAQTACAAGVVALGFPLHPPGRPGVSRAAELVAAGVPVTVLQGSRDAFGTPADIATAAPAVVVRAIEGADHGFGVRRRDGRSGAEIHAEVNERVLSAVLGGGS